MLPLLVPGEFGVHVDPKVSVDADSLDGVVFQGCLSWIICGTVFHHHFFTFLQVELHLVGKAPFCNTVGGQLDEMAVPGGLAEVRKDVICVLNELLVCGR